MADAVSVRKIFETSNHYVVHCTNISDGTGESAVVKVDKSAIGKAFDGAEPASLDIEKVVWNCDGMAVKIYWDHTTDDLALALSGQGCVDFREDLDDFKRAGSLKDPRSAGGAGDILFTTSGQTSGDTYNVTLWLKKSAD